MNPQPNQQPAHSPLPWRLDETSRFVYASNGEQVAAILPVTGSPKASIANAALIVRVNSHKALVDALRECVVNIEHRVSREEMDSTLERAREALRSATQ